MKWLYTLLLFVFLVPSLLPAQAVTMTATPYTSDVQTFMLSDFNFSGRGTSASELFILSITNQSAAPQPCELVLHIFSQNQGTLASGHTDPFTLEPNGLLTITNKNLFSAAQQFSLQDYKIDQAGDELKTTLLATGRLPSDTYIFHFQLLQGGALLAETEIRFVLTNPRTLDLISPGTVANSAEDGEIYSPYPLFRWESDISTVKLVIAEQLPDSDDGSSPEEVMQQRIVFENIFTVQNSGMTASALGGATLPSTLFQYPVGGARMLEAGKTYYWQMIGYVKSSGAPLEIPSEIWKFKIVGSGDQTLTPLQQQIINLVRELDASLLQPGGELNGYIPTEIVTKNGVVLRDADIINELVKMVDGDVDLLDVSVE